MIIDTDTDGDTLVDSYEDSAGFNKFVPNDLNADTNNDGESDLAGIIKDAQAIVELSRSSMVSLPLGSSETLGEPIEPEVAAPGNNPEPTDDLTLPQPLIPSSEDGNAETEQDDQPFLDANTGSGGGGSFNPIAWLVLLSFYCVGLQRRCRYRR